MHYKSGALSRRVLNMYYPILCVSIIQFITVQTIIVYKFLCTYHLKGCSKRFQSQSGCMYHVRTVYSNNPNIIHKDSKNGLENEASEEDDCGLFLEHHQDDYLADAENDNVPPSAPATPP